MVKDNQAFAAAAGRIDKQKKSVFDNRACFFKIFLPQIILQDLHTILIPPQFVKDTLKKVTASKAILKGPSGGGWALDIWKNGDDVFLSNGWDRFVKDNLIKDRDFLLFKYDGDMCFTVEIFDKSGVIRLPGDAILGSGSGLMTERRQVQDETHHDSGRDQQKPDVSRGKSTNLQNQKKCQPGERAVAAVDNEAITFTSQLPFFKMLIKDYNVRNHSYMVNIPRSFTNKHFSKDKNKIILRSMEGKTLEVNCRARDGNYSFGKGWRRFVEDNQLKVGDVCIFELVGEMELRFHIFNK